MEEILYNMQNNPHINLPYPIMWVHPSISTVTGLNKIDAKYRVYQKSGTLKLYGRDMHVVIWCPEAITTAVLGFGHNTLSFSFSGCCMARYTLNGKWYTAHVHCIEDIQQDCRRDFINYIRDKRILNCLIFRPLLSEDIFHDFQNRRKLLTWGLISKNNHCYTLCLEGDEDKCKFKIICIIQHIDAEKQSWNTRLFQYIPNISKGESFNELRQRWDGIFRYERRRLVYVDKEYRKYLQFRYR